MLKNVVFKNFVHFREHQHLSFKGGPNYIVGANSTGKSSIFELIRRCLSEKETKSSSSIPEDDKDAYILSEYEIKWPLGDGSDEPISPPGVGCNQLEEVPLSSENDTAAKKCILIQKELPSSLENETSDEKCIAIQDDVLSSSESDTAETCTRKLYSGLFVEGGNSTHRKLFKVSCRLPVNEGDDDAEVLVESMNYSPKNWKNENCCELNTTNSNLDNSFRKMIEISAKYQACDNENKDRQLSLLEHEVVNVFTELKILKSGSSGRKREDSLQSLTDTFVHVYPIRATGISQWSKSERLLEDDGRNNYKEADKNAEILNKLLNSSAVDTKTADKIFATLTSPLTYTFKRNGSDEYHVKYNGVDHSLLKTPDGIVAAKQTSLLLAHTVYKTICFEEIDHGMNPRMIEILRDIVLRLPVCQKKVILFISHSPAMVGNWTLDRTYFCRRNEMNDEKQSVSHYVTKVFEKENFEYGYELKREIKNILFASSVIFVEGPSDKFVLELLFDEIIDSEDMELKKIICGMYIAVLGSKTQYQNARQFAKRLHLKYSFLFDKDLVFEDEKKFDYVQNLKSCLVAENEKEVQEKIKKVFEKHIENKKCDIKNKWQKCIENTKAVDHKDYLAKQNIFLWESGDLDEMIFSSIIKHSTLQDEIKTELMLNLFKMAPRVYLSVDSRRKLYAHLNENRLSKEVKVLIGEDNWPGTLEIEEKIERKEDSPDVIVIDLSKQSLDTLRKVMTTDEDVNTTNLIIHTMDPDAKEKFKIVFQNKKAAKDKYKNAVHCFVMNLERKPAETLAKCLCQSEEILDFKTFLRDMK